MDSNNKYTKMQQNHYDNAARHWNLNYRDPVVGGFEQHNAWKDYDEFLFKNVDTNGKIGLDFGCGPGRNIVKFSSIFKQIDGTDISQTNLDNAAKWANHNKIPFQPVLYKSNGIDLSLIADNKYDVVFSTICLQHICVYDIRLNLFKEFYRILNSGGSICIQMGCGKLNKPGVKYYDNFYDATTTNGYCDVEIENIDNLSKDIENVGFRDFNYDIRPVGPGDLHSNWVFFRAKKS